MQIKNHKLLTHLTLCLQDNSASHPRKFLKALELHQGTADKLVTADKQGTADKLINAALWIKSSCPETEFFIS